jgi:transposase-like protein
MHKKCTPNWILCGVVAGPRGWLVGWLVMSLVCGLSFPQGASHSWDGAWLPESSAGWRRWRPSRLGCWVWRTCRILQASSVRLVCRVGLVGVLLEGSGLSQHSWGAWLLVGWPLLEWGLSVMGRVWPKLLSQAWYREGLRDAHQMYWWSVLGLMVLTAQHSLTGSAASWVMGGVVSCERDGSRVELERVEEDEDQITYRVRLEGEFEYTVRPRDEFETRLLILDLRRLRTGGRGQRGWGVVSQEVLGQVFGVYQERISQWEGYVRAGQWAKLLSLSPKSLLTEEVRQQIIEVWAMNVWQTAHQVRERLMARGVSVTQRVVEEAGRQSGLLRIRAQLKEQWVKGAEGLRPRDGYLVEQLFKQVDQLQTQLAQAQAIPLEKLVDVAALRALAGVPEAKKCLEKPWPWLFQVEHVLFGAWQGVEDEAVRCVYCGSAHVAVKSKTPRLKGYLDEHGQRQTVEVYRYYCQNPDCPYQTFTNLPRGLIVHSVWTLDARLRALELYTGLRTTYRGAAAALGVSPSTLYHWLAQFGDQPLQVAALFGMVRSSGVVGIDEKYVKVPKNNKPESKQRKWMYVYVAVDAHTLDLLHCNVYPNLGKDTARTFLLELRAKGYHPRVVITDLNPDYPEPLTAVFPNALHHQCVFHALQTWHRAFKKTFGPAYAETRPDLLKLRQDMDHIFQAKSHHTVQKRYESLMARRIQLVQAEPCLEPILDSLTRHYPRLLNAYDNPLIPLTNNATERLIRRFDQHYQNFAGFDSIETAHCYLHLFELTYRLTPFGPEVQPHLRGKCPLELAGYDLSRVPLASYLRQHGTVPFIPTRAEVVPK